MDQHSPPQLAVAVPSDANRLGASERPRHKPPQSSGPPVGQRYRDSTRLASSGSGPFSQHLARARLDLARPLRTGIFDQIAEILPGRAVRRDHDRAARQRRLERGQSGRLEPARQREDPRCRVSRGQQRVVMLEPPQPDRSIIGGAPAFQLVRARIPAGPRRRSPAAARAAARR